MLDQQDLKWIASTSTELNSILQQISRYYDLSRRHQGQPHYVELMGERVERAAKTAQALFDKVTSNILAAATGTDRVGRRGFTPFTVLPPPIPIAPAFASKTATATAIATVEKPKVQSSSSPNATIPAEIIVKNARGKKELLMLVEDEVEVAEVAAEMLADEGYRVIVAHDGFDALKIYEKIGGQIGLVILDFFLPVMDGDAVFDELRGLNPDIAVVLSSGFAEEQKISAMLGQGLRGFMPKPYSREKLLRQVRTTLDTPRQGRR